jgi:hypothetical protein
MRSLVVVLALGALLALFPAHAIGGAPSSHYGRSVWSYPVNDVEICGMQFDVVEEGQAVGYLSWYAENGGFRWIGTFTGTSTWTAANGRSLVIRYAQHVDNRVVVDEAAGTITGVYAIHGMDASLRPSYGGLFALDAGMIWSSDTSDLTTGEPLSFEFHIYGPHPIYDDVEGTLLCQALAKAVA